MGTTRFSIDFDDELRITLNCFREANRGAPLAKLIRIAIEEFVRRELERDTALRARFEEAKARALREIAGNVRFLRPKRRSRKAELMERGSDRA